MFVHRGGHGVNDHFTRVHDHDHQNQRYPAPPTPPRPPRPPPPPPPRPPSPVPSSSSSSNHHLYDHARNPRRNPRQPSRQRQRQENNPQPQPQPRPLHPQPKHQPHPQPQPQPKHQPHQPPPRETRSHQQPGPAYTFTSDSDEQLIQSGYVPPSDAASSGWRVGGTTNRRTGTGTETETGVSDEVGKLLRAAISGTERLSMVFDATSYLRRDAWKEVSHLCWTLGYVFRSSPQITHSYLPPKESTWCMRRALLIVSLKNNLKKYIRLSEHLSSKPLRIDAFRGHLEKLEAYQLKFSTLFGRIQASSEKMHLMQLRDAYERARRRMKEQVDLERARRCEAERRCYMFKAERYEMLRRRRIVMQRVER